MATVPAPTNYTYSFAINPDGSLRSGGDLNSTASPLIVVTNICGDASLPLSTVTQNLMTGGGISLPFGRYLCDWQALRNAINTNKTIVFPTF